MCDGREKKSLVYNAFSDWLAKVLFGYKTGTERWSVEVFARSCRDQYCRFADKNRAVLFWPPASSYSMFCKSLHDTTCPDHLATVVGLKTLRVGIDGFKLMDTSHDLWVWLCVGKIGIGLKIIRDGSLEFLKKM